MDADQRTPLQRRLDAKFPPLSNYFRWIEDLSPCRAVVWGRESTRQQDPQGNLNWQRLYYRRTLSDRGYEVLASFGEVGSGYHFDRPDLANACAYARRHGAILVAEATNRFVRPSLYNSATFPNAPYLAQELDRIAEIARGVTLATILHPDMPEFDVRGHQTKRGLLKPPPRGATKARNESAKATVLAMHADGYEQCEIRRVTAISSSNISRWIAGLLL